MSAPVLFPATSSGPDLAVGEADNISAETVGPASASVGRAVGQGFMR